MFWSLVVEPNKKYATFVKESFCVTMATLDTTTVENDADIFSLHVIVDSQDVIVCNLSKNLNLQVPITLEFGEGTEVTFYTTGKATVHLTGYVDDNEPLSENDSDTDSDSDEVPSLINPRKRQHDVLSKGLKTNKHMNNGGDAKSDDESSDEDSDAYEDLNTDDLLSDDDSEDDNDSDVDEPIDDEESDGSDDELSDSDESPVVASSKKKDPTPSSQNLVSNKKKQPSVNGTKDEKNDNASKQNSSKTKNISNEIPKKKVKLGKAGEEESQSGKMPKKNVENTQIKTLASGPKIQDLKGMKDGKNDNASKQNVNKAKNMSNEISKKKVKLGKAGEEESQSDKMPKKNVENTKKKTLAGGLIIEDLKVGSGPVAKPNKMVELYYIGRLKSNNKVFDKCTSGRGLKFKLGKGDVIKGMDMGVADMNVGTKRRLTIPPALAYGTNGSPPFIPKNSTLVFEIELKSVN